MSRRIPPEAGKEIKAVEPNTCRGRLPVETEGCCIRPVDPSLELPVRADYERGNRALLGNGAAKTIRPGTSENVVGMHGVLLRPSSPRIEW
jgi:hypothetical protein